MKEEKHAKKDKKICVNCQYMQINLGRNPNDSFPCKFLNTMISNVQENYCINWKKREIGNLI